MSRLNYMSDMEVALLTIREELACVERHATSGGSLGPDNLKELRDCQSRLQTIIERAEAEDQPTWETDNQARPEWFQPKTITIEEERADKDQASVKQPLQLDGLANRARTVPSGSS